MKAVSKEELITDIRKVINETNNSSLKNYQKHGQYCADLLHKKFHCGWRKVLQSIGINAENSTRVKREDLINDVLSVFTATGSTTQNNYIKNGQYSRAVITRIFGSWNKMLLELGYQVNMLKPGQYNQQNLINRYFEMKEELGRQPSAIEFRTQSGFSHCIITNCFGSYNEMMRVIGEPLTDNRFYTDQEIKQSIIDIYNRFGRVTSEEINAYCVVSSATIINRYGTLSNFLSTINIPLDFRQQHKQSSLYIKSVSILKQCYCNRIEYERTWQWFVNPQTNGNFRVDIFLPDINTVIEIDGKEHSISEKQLIDSLKDNLLIGKGIKVIRITELNYEKLPELLGL